jgi:hypothetical protein
MRNIKFICAAIAVCFFVACNSNDDKKIETVQQETVDTVSAMHPEDSARTIVNRTMIWTVEPQSGEKQKLQAPANKIDTFSSAHLVDLLNENFPDIHLDLIKVSHDTIYVKIPDSKKLTQEIGDTGADDYLAATTYTLTEPKNIKFVNIALKAGDHAEPGVYSREDFKELR